MAQASITATATVTLDGQAFNTGGTGLVDVTDITQQTRDVDTTYITLTSKQFAFMTVANLGDDDVIVRVRVDGGDYIFFGVPPAGHMLIPGHGNNGTIEGTFNNPSIRSVTSGGSRVFVMIGLNG